MPLNSHGVIPDCQIEKLEHHGCTGEAAEAVYAQHALGKDIPPEVSWSHGEVPWTQETLYLKESQSNEVNFLLTISLFVHYFCLPYIKQRTLGWEENNDTVFLIFSPLYLF